MVINQTKVNNEGIKIKQGNYKLIIKFRKEDMHGPFKQQISQSLSNIFIKRNRDDFGKHTTKCCFETYTGKPYVKKLMLNVRKTAPLNKTLLCLPPDLQIMKQLRELVNNKRFINRVFSH